MVIKVSKVMMVLKISKAVKFMKLKSYLGNVYIQNTDHFSKINFFWYESVCKLLPGLLVMIHQVPIGICFLQEMVK